MADNNERLLAACIAGDVTTVRSCLSAGADVNTRDDDDDTPLYLAIGCNHPQVVTELVSRQDIDLAVVDCDGYTALHLACAWDMSAIIPILGSRMAIHMLNIKDNIGDTALMVAVEKGHLSSVEEMAKLEGVDWLTRDSEGDTLEDVARKEKDKEEKMKRGFLTKELPPMPGLTDSSCEDDSDSTCSEDLEDGANSADKKYAPKKKSSRHPGQVQVDKEVTTLPYSSGKTIDKSSPGQLWDVLKRRDDDDDDHSSSEVSFDSTCSQDLEDGANPANKRYSPKKKSSHHPGQVQVDHEVSTLPYSSGKTIDKRRDDGGREKNSVIGNKREQVRDGNDDIKTTNEDIGSHVPSFDSASIIRDFAVQTDLSSLDLDKLVDPIIHEQTNAAFEAYIKNFNEMKVMSKETNVKVKILSGDKKKLEVEICRLKGTIQEMEETSKIAVKKYESERQKSATIKVELNNTRLKLENEKRVNLQLQRQLQSSREQKALIKTLKLQCLKINFEGIKAFLMGKKMETEKLMTYLVNNNQASLSTIQPSLDKLNEYSTLLYQGMDNLQVKYEEKILKVETSPVSVVNVDLNFNTSSFEKTQLTSVANSLRLLNLHTRPQVVNEATRLPVLSRPPSLSHGESSLTNNPTSISAAIAKPMTAASPRRDPSYLPPSTTTATFRTLAGPRPADGRPKSYIKLVTQLKSHFLELNTTDAFRYIHMLRRENGDTLSGLMMQTIYDRVGRFMSADRNMRMVDMENDMDNNCSICLEDMTERDSRMLNPCNHKFHNHCINDWLAKPGGAGNTCPMCRHFILQEDKFPDLGHFIKRKL